jgi:signal transduction histidine kinase
VSFSRAVAPRGALSLIDSERAASGLVGVALLGGLAIALVPSAPAFAAVAVAGVGAGGALRLLVPPALGAVRRHRSLGLLGVLILLAVAWVLVGLRTAGGVAIKPQFPGPMVSNYTASPVLIGAPYSDWPWRVARIAILPLGLTLLAAAGGLVLLADAVRVQLGLVRRHHVPWRVMTMPLERRGQIASRAVPGVALIAAAAAAGLGALHPYATGNALLEGLVLLAVGAWAAALIASPVLVGVLMRLDRDKAGTAREIERQRFAAHLHDSVLQTLALVQRQAHDPAAVIRLARRQEHALRAWMAGEAELASETLVAALREVVALVEDEHELTIELTAIGDWPLDPAGEALVAASREALRNAARHAPGAPVYVFAEISALQAEVFVRDEGGGFDLDSVPAERRGVRDAVFGRMAAVGGSARIESTDEGTEVTLFLGARNGR